MEITLCCKGLGGELTQQISDSTWLTHRLSHPVKTINVAVPVKFTYPPPQSEAVQAEPILKNGFRSSYRPRYPLQ